MCFLLLLLLALAGRVAAQSVPTDTLPGHAQRVRSLSATLCAALSSPQAPDLSKMSTAGVVQYAQGLFENAMRRDSTRVSALFEAAAARGIQPADAARLLGHDAMANVARTCPAARPLAIRLAQTEPGQQAIAAQQPKLPLAEQNALQPVANDLCTALNAASAHAPFAQLTPAGRKQMFMSAVQKVFTTRTAALKRFYGPAKYAALLRNGQLDSRIASLMVSQGKCSVYLLLIGSDRLAERDKR